MTLGGWDGRKVGVGDCFNYKKQAEGVIRSLRKVKID